MKVGAEFVFLHTESLVTEAKSWLIGDTGKRLTELISQMTKGELVSFKITTDHITLFIRKWTESLN